MKILSLKTLLPSAIFILSSTITFSAYAWPEVDHMNMCGTAGKVVRTYYGSWKGWQQHDQFIATRGSRYYVNANCPKIISPSKSLRNLPTKKVVSKNIIKSYQAKNNRVSKQRFSSKKQKINISPKSRLFRTKVKYDEKADCARVDRMNRLTK